MKKFLRNILFSLTAIFLSFVIFIIVLEITSRIQKARGPDNPLTAITQKGETYLFEPNAVYIHTSPETNEKHEVHINKYGYRGKDFAVPKPKDVIRIFAVGDSFVHGVGMADNQTVPFQLQEALNVKGINAQVINAGIGHTSPISHYMNLRKIHFKYEPDLVLLFFDFTDLWDDWQWEQRAVFDKSGVIERFDPDFTKGKRDWWRTCNNHSHACRYVNNKIIRTFQKIHTLGIKEYARACREGKRAKSLIAQSQNIKDDNALIEYDGLLLMRGRARQALIEKHWARTATYLTKIRDLLREKNIPLILVSYPPALYVGADEWSKGREPWGFEVNKLYTDHYPFELIASFAQTNGIPYIATLKNFLKVKAETHKKYYYDWDGHLNPEGNRILMESVLNSPIFQNELQKLQIKP